jgi:putative CRISPR-associated protein (TIGR02619 family)
LGNSAELNSFLRVVAKRKPENIEIYLFGTKTNSNELCRRAIERYLIENSYKIFTSFEISGYFLEVNFDESYAKSEFQKGVAELLDRLIYLAKKKRSDGYKVYLNPTGGLKAHVIVTALAGFLMSLDVYYMHEEFNDVVFLPGLFYLPKKGELEILRRLKNRNFINGKECRELIDNYPDEIERLRMYGLIDIGSGKKDFFIKSTTRGEFFLELVFRK